MARYSDNPELAIECSARLIRIKGAQHPEQQTIFFFQYLHTLRTYHREPSKFVIPILESQSIRVVYGARPVTIRSSNEQPTKQEVEKIIPEQVAIGWEDLERAAFHNLMGRNTPFLAKPLISDEFTENTVIRETPPFEKFRVEIRLRNPLGIPLVLSRVRLGVNEVII